MYTINIDTYAQNIKALVTQITDVNVSTAGRRTQRTSSTVMHEIIVVSGVSRVTLLLQEGGLYIKGFRNTHGTYRFRNENSITGTQLSFSCSYIGTNSIGIFADDDSNNDIKKVARSKHSIDQAVRDLAAYNGGRDNSLKIPLALMVFLISESLRFTVVYDKMVEVCKGNGMTFTFGQFQKWVQSWSSISDGSAIPAGTCQAHVFTYQS